MGFRFVARTRAEAGVRKDIGAVLSILIVAFCGDAFAPLHQLQLQSKDPGHTHPHTHTHACIKHDANEKRKCQPGDGERFSRCCHKSAARNEGKLHATAICGCISVPTSHLLRMQRMLEGASVFAQWRSTSGAALGSASLASV